MWRSIGSYFDRQLPRTQIGKYKHCYNGVLDVFLSKFLSLWLLKYPVKGW